MRAGLLRHRVSIQEKVQTPDGQGGNTTAWVNVEDLVAASVEPDDQGQEEVRDQHALGTMNHTVTMRARPEGITPSMRLLFHGRILDVKSAQNVAERGRQMVVRCVERIGVLLTFSGTATLAPATNLTVTGNMVFSGAATVAPGNPSLTATGDNGIFQVYNAGDSLASATVTRSTTATYTAGP